MTRKEAIEIVADLAKSYSRFCPKWKGCSVKAYRVKGWGRVLASAFSENFPDNSIAAKRGYGKRYGDNQGGWDFTREWLEKNGHL